MTTRDQKPQSEKDKQKYQAFLRYSGMGMQFFVTIGVSAWIGQKLDAYFALEKPFITIFLVLLFATGYFIKLYKDLTR